MHRAFNTNSQSKKKYLFYGGYFSWIKIDGSIGDDKKWILGHVECILSEK